VTAEEGWKNTFFLLAWRNRWDVLVGRLLWDLR